jgi:hypothetical protein
MDSIFTLGDMPSEGTDVNLDELYEHEQKRSLADLALYNRVLSRVHAKVRLASRQRQSTRCCWYLIPETLIGIPRYDPGACTAYLIDKLRGNGFLVRYTHPNLLLVGWGHWVPGYVRKELRKKTGIELDGMGQERMDPDQHSTTSLPPLGLSQEADALLSTAPPDDSDPASATPFRDTASYRPIGNLVYDDNMLRDVHMGVQIPPRSSPG